MRNLTILFGVVLACSALAVFAAEGSKSKEAAADAGKDVPPVLNFTMDSLDGKPVNLSKYQGKVVLIVNTASKCGNTPQYEQLQKLHEKYSEKGLAVIGFPANDFKQQEPGTNEDIAAFCKKNYGVTFDMFSKIVVKGQGQAPLYKFLTSKETNPNFAGDITWNFEKFLVGKNGQVVARFKPKMHPDDPEIIKAIEAELAK
jgi:glutathione peroxidase